MNNVLISAPAPIHSLRRGDDWATFFTTRKLRAGETIELPESFVGLEMTRSKWEVVICNATSQHWAGYKVYLTKR